MNRRDFIVKTSLATAAATLLSRRLGAQDDASKGVSLVMEAADPDMGAIPVQWAADRLRETLGLAGFAVRNCARLSEAPEEDPCIVIAGTGSRLSREAGVVAPEHG
ncbi:MAG TPA: twin-arginine translocation signal domain-containing protein, partial [Opitutaceae bacterium]|nr:twin-arginine translocation signal domain-containing protein [Opitutaceae bacterium]